MGGVRTYDEKQGLIYLIMAAINPICVLVMKSDAFLMRAVASLMTRSPDLDVVVSEAEDMQTLNSDLEKIKPDVVLVNDSLAERNAFAPLLKRHDGLKIVVASLYANRLHVIGQEEITVTSLEDLLSAICTD